MKNSLSKLNIGEYVIGISALGLIIMSIVFIIDIFALKLYHNLHLLLWVILMIASIVIYSGTARFKNNMIENITVTVLCVSLIAITIDTVIMFIRFVGDHPIFCVICAALYLILLTVDLIRFRER